MDKLLAGVEAVLNAEKSGEQVGSGSLEMKSAIEEFLKNRNSTTSTGGKPKSQNFVYIRLKNYGSDLGGSAGKEDPVELDSSLTL